MESESVGVGVGIGVNGDISSYDRNSFAVGVTLAVCSSVFIGSSFIIKKFGLRRLAGQGYLRAGAGGFRYLRDWMWWLGLIVMGVGEAFNFIAYAFAPASLVTPLGALSVLVAAILSSRFLNEKLNLLGKLGCLLCIVGSTVLVIHSPKQEEIESLEQLELKLREPQFLSYLVMIIFIFFTVSFYLGPKYGKHNVTVYIFLCSAVGSLTVVFCKGIGISLRETLSGYTNDFNNWTLWSLIVATILCIMIQMNYLNKSLDIFNTSVVTPVYYVMFTSFVIIASAILFKEWESLSTEDVLGNICGFINVITGISMLNVFKDIDLSSKDSTFNMRSKKETVSLNPHDENEIHLEAAYGTYGSRTA